MINNYKKFLNSKKAILIAPAGHGKTYAIAQCIKLCSDSDCQLILTHTHAGVASIIKKLQAEGINKNKYLVETIDSFIRKYVCAFTNFNDQNIDRNTFYDELREKACEIFKNNVILDIISISYQGIFVDEYQDCNIYQHEIIKSISKRIPVHLFGDPLQGIFDFNGSLVDFDNDLTDFKFFDFLMIPWRWNNKGNCKALGEKILAYS